MIFNVDPVAVKEFLVAAVEHLEQCSHCKEQLRAEGVAPNTHQMSLDLFNVWGPFLSVVKKMHHAETVK